MGNKKSWIAFILCITSLILAGCSNVSFYDKLEQMEQSSKKQEQIQKDIEDSLNSDTHNKAKGNANDVYENMKEKSSSSFYTAINEYSRKQTEKGEKIPLTQQIWLWFYAFFASFRVVAPWIIVFSILCGGFIAIFARRNKKVRKFGIYGLMIGVPFFMIAVLFGVAMFNGIFLYD